MGTVTRFMTAEGLSPSAEYFLGSDFLMGMRIETPFFFLTYRQEKERLILCDFSSRQDDKKQAVLSLRALLKKLISTVSGLCYIDAMILPGPPDSFPEEMKHRLIALMISEGARPVCLDGQWWLRFRIIQNSVSYE